MKTNLLLFIALALLTACDSSDQLENRSTPMVSTVTEQPIGHDDIDARDTITVKQSEFNAFFTRFQTAVYNEDATTFNHFIDQERGLYLIENPGAMPLMTRVKDITNFRREFQQRSFFTIKERLQTCQLKEETLPTFNCETNTGYSKEGCFVADAAAFRKTEIHKYASLPEDELKSIEATLPLVQKTVLQTSSSYQFHFGKINGQWKVLFIDLRIPCSA